MSTGLPPLNGNFTPVNGHSYGHSRGRGHNRSRYAQPPPTALSLDLSNASKPPSSDSVVTDADTVNANANDLYGHAPTQSWSQHNHSHTHSHSNGHVHPHSHSHSHSSVHHHHAHSHSITSIHHDTPHIPEINPQAAAHKLESSVSQVHEVLAGALIALPWIALSWYPRICTQQSKSAPDGLAADKTSATTFKGIEQAGQKACVLTAVTLLLFGVGRLVRLNYQNGSSFSLTKYPAPSAQNAQAAFLQICSIGLPIYAELKVGGFLVAFALLLATATGLPSLVASDSRMVAHERYGRKIFTLAVLGTAIILSYLGLNNAWGTWPLTGYLALLLSIFVISPPFPVLRRQGPIQEPGLVADSISKQDQASGSNPSAVVITTDAPLALVSGSSLLVLTILADSFYLLVPAGLLAAALMVSSPAGLRSSQKFGLAVSTGAASLLCSPHIRDDIVMVYAARCLLALVSFFAARMDDKKLRVDAHSHSHTHHHHHNHSHESTEVSVVTKWLLRRSETYPLLYSILKEKDSRSIFYFMCLNFSFMLVQLSYGFMTGSLGLLSDSIHMFFDCLALVVGLCAAVMSKWPPNARFPYGYGKVDTLSGFANGIFLMIISVEIIYEAVERLSSGSEMHRIGELLVVSIAGLLVNLVGIFSFEHGHHHHGHDHGHDHSHGNENMHGIFLHILADTLGSVAVVISTILVHYSGWSGYDPLASCFIAILIFASAVPLVSSTAKTLLLTLPADTEYNVRETLAGVSTLRGVVSYTVPKFWLDDTGSSSSHSHSHGHDHDHSGGCESHQDHSHQHDQGHGHNHSHSHAHSHDHAHHDHDHDHDHERKNQKVFGVIHVVASRGSDLEDVRQRTVDYLREQDMDIVVQVERDGDGRCWCGGGTKSS
ncbi:uncharacterized protein N7469_006502 [Penicillium citrinum]|uniref:Zinc transporter n=1 Tax=Penicillium citrinum TaxID=5077 RepID=A0A9W9NY50_PENCI|nr:uncharacterized protein N7469_006502 [Penicillium citrinum]KAJ5231914.1 hypothetical protein N7469_006502 [Penicillium citrinum]